MSDKKEKDQSKQPKSPEIAISNFVGLIGGISKRNKEVLLKMYSKEENKTVKDWCKFILDRNHDNIHAKVNGFLKKL